MTKGTYYPLISQFLKIESKKKLSRAALETLAIISYKQPITKSVMESIRGVSCDYAVQKLLEKELIEIVGRAEGPGRPLLYATSAKFMDHFGLKDLKDLPKVKEFELPSTEIGIKDTDEQPESQFIEDGEAIPTEEPESTTPAEEPESTTPSEEQKDSDLSLLDSSENAMEGPTESSAEEEPSATTPENPVEEASEKEPEKELAMEKPMAAPAEELSEPPLNSVEEPVSLADMQQSVNALDEEE